MDATDLEEWKLTATYERRWNNWITGNGHGARGDIRNTTLAWSPLQKPLAECNVALVTTCGVHLASQEPFDLLDPEGDWSYREIPSSTPSEKLLVSHSHYNHEDADADVNCVFPIDRVRELHEAGAIGGVAPTFFGLMGFVPNPRPLLDETAPEVATRLVRDGVDVVVLSPG